jgi:hypothetical protein
MVRHLPARRLACAVLLATACSDSTAPPTTPPPGLLIVAAPEGRDTVAARPAQALIVEVRDTLGVLQSGTTVRFQSLVMNQPELPGCCQYASMFISGLQEDVPTVLSTDTTNSEGRAAAIVYFGTRAGPGGIIVTVPELGLVDTAEFTLDAGDPVHIQLIPPDTTIMIGGSIANPQPKVMDTYLNPRDDDVALSTVGSLLTSISGGGFASGSQPGRAMIIGSLGALRDTAMVSVVPAGQIAAQAFESAYTGLIVANLDGSDRTVVWTSTSYFVMDGIEWAADGQSIVHNTEIFGVPHLNRTGLDGTSQALVPPGVDVPGWPSPSADGQWVYFSGQKLSTYQLWRMHPDGSGLEKISPPGVGLEWRPGISRNGNLLAFIGSGPRINIRDLTTGSTIVTDHPGQVPHFSPVDDRIAFLAGSGAGPIAVMNADGTNVQVLTPTTDYGEALDWSPDGKWIVARRGSMLVLIEVDTGMLLPLSWTNGLTHPSWRPE